MVRRQEEQNLLNKRSTRRTASVTETAGKGIMKDSFFLLTEEAGEAGAEPLLQREQEEQNLDCLETMRSRAS